MNKAMLIILVFFVSCEGTFESQETRRMEKALVFGARNVEQLRGTMSRATSEAEGSAKRDYAYQAAQLLRATATLHPSKFGFKQRKEGDPPLPPNSPPCVEIGEKFGSGTLTSDSRIVSAYHTAHGAVEAFPVSFESLSLFQNLPGSPVGHIVADGPIGSNYPPNQEQTIAHRADSFEESPFLANRLFVLGLDRWADETAGVQARIGLRTGFYYELDKFGSNDTGYDPNTVGNQGFVKLMNPGYEGRDIAVLRPASANTLIGGSHFSLLPSGEFTIKKPAVFFGQVRTGDIKEHPFRNETNFLNHTNSWPDKLSIGRMVPLTSFTAISANIFDTTTSGLCENSQPVDFVATGLFQTSFDSLRGSSGGMVLTPHGFEQPPYHTERPLIGMGVLSNGTAAAGDDRFWSVPVSQFPTVLNSISVTGMASQDSKLFERDIVASGDPSNPTPIIEGDYPNCLAYNSDDECVAWVSTTHEPTGGPEEPKNSSILIGDESEKVGADTARRFHCPSHESGVPPGIMVGIQGGLALNGKSTRFAAQNIVENGGGVGTFMAVCTPFSSRSYTDNWGFLNIIGAQMPRDLDTLGGPFGWGRFDRYQSRVYEERPVGGKALVRPPSTKMCPPNYLLRRIKFAISDEGTHYSGVTAIDCFKGDPNSNGPDVLRMPLLEVQSNYTLAGKPFSLTQLIGYPIALSGNTTTAGCVPGEAMYGMQTHHDKKGRLVHVKTQCLPAP